MSEATANKVIFLMTALATYVGSMPPAIAEVLRWNLENIVFVDHGTATGFFSWDTAQQRNSQLTNFDVKVTGGSFPFEYTPNNSAGYIQCGPGGCSVPTSYVNLYNKQWGVAKSLSLRTRFAPTQVGSLELTEYAVKHLTGHRAAA